MLTERMQQAMVYRLYAQDVRADAADVERMTDPWRSVYRLYAERVDQDASLARNDEGAYAALAAAINQAGLVAQSEVRYWDKIDEVIDEMEGAAKRRRRYRSFREIKDGLPAVRWLWGNWIPRGMISVVGGFPGTGKSWFVLDLARMVIHGGTWPDGSAVLPEQMGPVIWVEGEGIPQVVKQREEGLRIDDSQLYMLLASEGEMLDLATERWRNELIEMVGAIRPRLIIVDSLRSVSSNSTNQAEQVNPLLLFLAGVARFGDCAVVIVHHLRKPGSSQLAFPLVTIHDFAGSQHLVAMARTAIGLSVMQNGGGGFSLRGPRRIDLCKTFDEQADPLGVVLETLGEGRKRLVYGEAPSAETTMRQECGDWLIEFLEAEGPARTKDVLAAAEEAGYGRDTVFRARKELEGRIVNTHGAKHRSNKWALSEQIGSDESQESQESQESDTL